MSQGWRVRHGCSVCDDTAIDKRCVADIRGGNRMNIDKERYEELLEQEKFLNILYSLGIGDTLLYRIAFKISVNEKISNWTIEEFQTDRKRR